MQSCLPGVHPAQYNILSIDLLIIGKGQAGGGGVRCMRYSVKNVDTRCIAIPLNV